MSVKQISIANSEASIQNCQSRKPQLRFLNLFVMTVGLVGAGLKPIESRAAQLKFNEDFCENQSLRNLPSNQVNVLNQWLNGPDKESAQATKFIFVKGFLNELYGKGNTSIYFLDMENTYQRHFASRWNPKNWGKKVHESREFPSAQDINTSTEELCSLIETRAAKENSRFIVIGHSMGGAIVANLAAKCDHLFKDGTEGKSPIRAAVAIQAVLGGTPVADSQFERSAQDQWQKFINAEGGGLEKLTGSLMEKVSKLKGEGMRSLGTAASLARAKEISKAIDAHGKLFYVTTRTSAMGKKDAAHAGKDGMIWHVLSTGKFMEFLSGGKDLVSDGLVPFESQEIPGIGKTLFSIDGADHFDLVISKFSDFSPDVVTDSKDACKKAFANKLLLDLKDQLPN